MKCIYKYIVSSLTLLGYASVCFSQDEGRNHADFWLRKEVGVIVIAFVLIVVLVRWISLRFSARKKDRIIEEQKHSLDRKNQELFKLKNEKLETTVRTKDSELAEIATKMAGKYDVLNTIARELDKIADECDPTLKKKLVDIIRNTKKSLKADDELEQFEQHFNQVHNDFLHRIKEAYPEITPANLKMCGYLRMNLSSKEIADILYMSLSAVEKSRYRIRRKLNLPNETNLVEFLMEF